MKTKLKIIFSLGILILVVGILGLVSAETYANTFGKGKSTWANNNYIIKQYPAGWNLIPISFSHNILDFQGVISDFPESQICKNSFDKIFYYHYIHKKYYSELDLEGNEKVSNEFVSFFRDSSNFMSYSNAGTYWSYYDKPCFGAINKEQLSGKFSEFENNKLSSGWNFISIVPQMVEKSLDSIKGDCGIVSAYSWEGDSQKWATFPLSVEINEDTIGVGLVIKVQDNCELNLEGSSVNSGVPPLPQ